MSDSVIRCDSKKEMMDRMKVILKVTEEDFAKAFDGNVASAQRRVRSNMRELRTLATNLSRLTLKGKEADE